jgi:hypothetical protein
VVDELVALLARMKEEMEQDSRKRDYQQVSAAIYDVLDAYVQGRSPKNELYIARHFDLFLAQVHAHLCLFVWHFVSLKA